MGHLVIVASCTLNQWALDFDGNCERVIESIRQAKAAGATLRCGPELEITGYGCLDHFLEADMELHCFDSLAEIISHKDCQDILLDIGMPLRHRNVNYNCRILAHNKKILLIRPKLSLAQDGNYREMRYFTPWKGVRVVEEYFLPSMISKITGQLTVPIGDAVISTRDTCIGAETCEELFTPNSPHIGMGLDGVEIFTNSSGSHHELRKLHTRIELITEATLKSGGIYLYANQRGCDGDRLYYDGSAMIISNGRILAQASQFSLNDVEVITAVVDLEEIRSYRTSKSRGMQAKEQKSYQRIFAPLSLGGGAEDFDFTLAPTKPVEPSYHIPEEEIALGPACYLFDFLRRSGAAGYFIPLSGGIDSCATSVIVYSMCRLVHETIKNGNKQVCEDLLRITGQDKDSQWRPKDPQEIAGKLFCSAYMGMEGHSSQDTRQRAKDLAADIGSLHFDFGINPVVAALLALFKVVTGIVPKFRQHGGTNAESLAIQNIQARIRMVISYMFAQLVPGIYFKRERPGSLLVLGSANVDESLRGYLTKYDCSSADINPIGSISKNDLMRFILYAGKAFDMPLLQSFIDAPPTAELEPLMENYTQSDEADMGMTYNELSRFGRLRKIDKLGPYGMFMKLLHEWGALGLSPQEIYEKVRRFFSSYAINRHKMTVMTPAYHAESYSPCDHRFDLRPFLYPVFTAPYRRIEKAIARMGAAGPKSSEIEKKDN